MGEKDTIDGLNSELILVKQQLDELKRKNKRIVKFDDDLFKVKENVRGLKGKEFFASLLKAISECTGLDYLFIAVPKSKTDTMKTLVVLKDNELVENFIYPLKNSPCEFVSTGEIKVYEKDVQSEFSQSKNLKQFEAEGFIGIPLLDSNGKVLGVLAAIHRTELEDLDYKMAILQYFEERVASEIVCYKMQKEIINSTKKQDKQFQTFLSNLKQIALIIDRTGAVQYCNQYLCELSGYKNNEIVGENWFDKFIPKDVLNEVKDLFSHAISNNEFSEYYENPIKIKNGNEHLVRWTNTLFFDSEGNVTHVASIGEDITDKKKNELEVIESEARFKALANATSEAIFISEKGICIETNKTACEIFGYTYDELIGIFGTDIVAEESKELVKQNMINGFEEPYEAFAVKKDGTKFPVVFHGKMFEYKGKQLRITTTRDISLRKEAFEKLQLSEKKYRNLVDTIPLGVIVHQNGMLKYANKYSIKLLKYERFEDVANQPVFNFIHQNYHEPIKEALAEIQASFDGTTTYNSSRWEIELVRSDGTTVEVESNGTPILYEGNQAFQTIFSDISDKKEAEKKLIKSEKQYRTLIQNLPISVAIHQEGRIVYINEQAKKTFGYGDESVAIGKNVLDFVHPDYHKTVIERVKESSKSGLSSEPLEELFLREDGDFVPVEVITSPIHWDGKLAQQVLFMDITERKAAEKILIESEKKYKNLVAEMEVGVVVHKNGLLIYANNYALKTMGYKNFTEVDSMPIDKVIHPEFKEIVSDRLKDVIANNIKAEPMEQQYLKKDGSTIDVQAVASLIDFEGLDAIQTIFIDISHKKEVERQLKESESKFRVLFETLSQGVVFQQKDGKVISANRAAMEILGVTEDQLLGKTSMDPQWRSMREDGTDFPGEEHPAMVALQTGKSQKNVIMRVYHPKTDSNVWISIDAVPRFQNGETEPYQAYAIFTDITERKNAIHALQESEKKYRQLVETLPLGTAIFKDLKLLYANQAAVDMLNYDSLETALNTNILDFIHPDDRERSLNRQMSALQSGKQLGYTEMSFVKKDGSPILVESIMRPVYYEGKPALQVLFSDLTERKEAQTKLKESEKRFRTLFENMKHGFALHELVLEDNGNGIDYIFLEVNSAYELLTGLQREEVLGRRVTEVLPGTQDDPANWIVTFAEVVKTGRSVSFENYSEAIEKWFAVTAYKSSENRFAVLIDDITERKKMEIELHRLNEALENKVDERTSQLEDALNELMVENDKRKQIQDDLVRYQGELHKSLEKEKELNKLKSAFISMVSHQYRTPLTIIQTSTELLSRYHKTQNDEKHAQHLAKITLSIDKMTEMLEKIMLIGKFDAVDTDINFELFNINEIIYIEIERLRVFDKNQHEFEFTYSSPEINILTHRFFIEQLVNNLLSNAAKYSPESNIVNISCMEKDDFIELIITDKGIGIPEEDLKDIFEHFYRGSNVENIYGTGLGLSIVKRFCDKLNARITINSKIGKGTTVKILIPKESNKSLLQ